MVSVLISFSRITLLAFVLAFTFIDIIQIFEFKNSEVFGSVMSTIQSVMVVLFLCNTSIILYLVREDSIYLFLLAGQLLLFALIGISLNKLTYPMSKALINNPIISSVSLACLLIHSSSDNTISSSNSLSSLSNLTNFLHTPFSVVNGV